MNSLAAVAQRLQSAPVVPVRGTLVRLVPFEVLAKGGSADWLFTSGKPNRYNPAGVQCVYFAEDDATARAEYDACWAGLTGRLQPVVTYYGEVGLQHVLDLSSVGVVKAMGIKQSSLFAPWRRAKRPTLTQLIGLAVSEQSVISAIRYASKAARDKGFAGTNIVIFRDCIGHPDNVRIFGPTKKALQRWP